MNGRKAEWECFGCERATGECLVTNYTRCPGQAECPFFKTRQQAAADRAAWAEAMRAKPASQQEHIAATYYGGKMPWQGTEKNDLW